MFILSATKGPSCSRDMNAVPLSFDYNKKDILDLRQKIWLSGLNNLVCCYLPGKKKENNDDSDTV